MRKIIEIIESLEKTPGRLDKESILKANDSPALRFVFDTANNPLYNYYINDFNDGEIYRDDIPTFKEIKQLREDLINKKYIGNEAREKMRKVLLTKDKSVNKWLTKIFKKNLVCGVSTSTINKIFDNMIPTFDIGLCSQFDDKDIIEQGEWIIEPKYDGLRCIAFIDKNYGVTFVSRNNKSMFNLGHVEKQLSDLFKKKKVNDVILDGEMYAANWNDSITILRSQKTAVDNRAIKYYVFDVITTEEWKKQSSIPLEKRKEKLIDIFDKAELDNVEMTPFYNVKNLSEAEKKYEILLNQKFEGAVLKNLNAEYPFGRNKAWLKWKPCETYDVEVVDYQEGTGKNKGMLGAFICEYKGVKIHVGSGYTDNERIMFWKDKDKMIGKTVEVKCQEVTKDGSFRFPVFLKLREDK